MSTDVPDGVSFERDDRGGTTVMMDGQPQSHVQPDDPTMLAFEYVQHLALAIDAHLPDRSAQIGITHVGGAGLTLPRWVQATRPGTPQIVLEPNEALTAAVRQEIPLPRGHRIRVRPQDGLTGVRALKDASAEVVVTDAYAGGRVPAELSGAAYVREVARVLAPGGVALWNLADEPGLAWAARALATVRAALPELAIIAPHEVLKRRRFGNLVAMASTAPLPVADLQRLAAASAFPTGVRAGDDLTRLMAGATPFGDVGEASPPPPPSRGWRVV